MAHRFRAIDRGAEHRHRFTPSCLCGWVGSHRRTRDAAARQWRVLHVRSIETIDHRRVRRRLISPHRLTPAAHLPEVLRAPEE